jgi:hypothetical protein
MSRQHILPSRNLENRPHQKKDSNIQRHKHKYEHQVSPRTPHKKQENHESPENEIESDGDIVGWCSGTLRCVSGCGISACDTPYRVNKYTEAEEKRRKSAAMGLVRLMLWGE